MRYAVKAVMVTVAAFACVVSAVTPSAQAHPVANGDEPRVSPKAVPRVPVEVTQAAAISPSECSGRHWVFVSFKADVPDREFRAVVRTKIDRSWIFSFETERTDKVLPIFIKGSCKTIYRMLDAGATRTRVTVVVSAPGYRDTKLAVELPVRY